MNKTLLTRAATAAVALASAGFAVSAAQDPPPPPPDAPRQGVGERIGESIDKAAGAVRKGVRDASAEIRDQFAKTKSSVQAMGVQARVYSRLHWDKSLNAFDADLTVEVGRDGVATLKGSLPDAKAKARAVVLAGETLGVTKVLDETVVRPSSAADAAGSVRPRP